VTFVIIANYKVFTLQQIVLRGIM